MSANPGEGDERRQLSRVHAVLAAISITLIGQITSASAVTHHLREAVFVFAAAILLNVICYILETGIVKARVTTRFGRWLASLLTLMAVYMPLAGVSAMIRHFSEIAGVVFLTLGTVPIALVIAGTTRELKHLRTRLQSLNEEWKSISEQAKVLRQEFEELAQQDAEAAEAPSNNEVVATRPKPTELSERRSRLKERVREQTKQAQELDRRGAELDLLKEEVEQWFPRITRHRKNGKPRRGRTNSR